MRTFFDSHVSGVLIATHPLGRVVSPIASRWHHLTDSLFDRYRPELHYMRGRGPKWREKHARDAG